MAWTTPRTWNAGETVTSTLMNVHIRDNLNFLYAEVGQIVFSRGGVLFNPNGITASSANIMAWPYATRPCTVVRVSGRRVGGSAATINARKNGSSNHLSSDLSLSVADTVYSSTTIQNASYSIGDTLEVMLVSQTGNPTEIDVQVDIEPA
jgi:hypothetical protein